MPEKQSADKPQRYCRNCGAELVPSNRFCVYCGAPVDPNLGVPVSPSEESTSKVQVSNTVEAAKVPHKVPTPADGDIGHAGSSDEYLRRSLHGLTGRFKTLPTTWKVALALGIAGSLVVLGPVAFLAGAVLIGVSIIALTFRLAKRRPWKRWGIVGAVAILATVAFGSVSDALYDTRFMGFVGAGYASNDSSGLDSVEKRYLRETDTIHDTVVGIGNDHIDLYNTCQDYCSQGNRIMLEQNVQSIDDLLGRARALDPPEGYENSHDAFLAGMEIADKKASLMEEGAIDGPAVDRMIDEQNAYFDESFYLFPTSGRRYYDLHLRYE